MDLSNTFDTINHDIFLFKSKAYGFKKNSGFLLEAILQTSVSEQKLATFSVTGTKS